MVGDASENKFYINFGAHKEKKNDCQRREREKKKNETTAKKYATDGEGSIWIYIFSKAMITGYIHLTFRRKRKKRREVNCCSKESKNGVEQSMKEL